MEPISYKEKPNVLIIDDHSDLRLYLKQELKSAYNVIEAIDGKDGYEKAKTETPDIIICDIMMPEMDGLELSKLLKKDPDTAHIPIMLLTAKESDETLIEGLISGADDYIRKPFNPNILKIRLQSLLNQSVEQNPGM